jgi:predicted esterase
VNPGVPALTVRGGSNGIAANAAHIREAARFYGRAADACAEQALTLHACLVEPAVLASAVLDPLGAVRFEQALLAALDGRHGLSAAALRCAQTDLNLRAGAMAYVQADRLEAQWAPAVAGIVGLGPGIAAFAHGMRSGGAGQGFAELAAADPQLADTAVDMLSSFWSDHALIATVASLPDGHPDVRRVGVDVTGGEPVPPRSVRDLMTALAWRDRPRTGGDIDVRFVYSCDGRGRWARRAIVDIPGTKSWRLSPSDTDPTSLSTSLRSISGATTTYQAGVLEAMRQAGVGRAEPVLLVGHSQGGMVAVDVAREAASTAEFTVTNVVTAGAPIARLSAPAATQVLSLENAGDVVPHADGAGNADEVNHTTVTAHRNSGDAVVNHAIESSYVPAAGDVDASDDPSVRIAVRSLQPFLTGQQVRTVVYHVARR